MSATDGTMPMGVETPSASPSTRPTIHLSTRLFSPKPGHRNRPSPPRRNQLTKKIFGSLDSSAFLPRSIQCWQ